MHFFHCFNVALDNQTTFFHGTQKRCNAAHRCVLQIFRPAIRKLHFYLNLFVCNRGDTYYRLQTRKLSLVFLTPRPLFSSHQHSTLVCLFLIWTPTLCSLTSKSHYCSPRVLWPAGCIQQPKLFFLQHLAISGFPQSDHTVNKLSADTGSL